MKLSRCILPLLLTIALLFPTGAWAAGIPDFAGAAAVELNRNIPAFLPEDYIGEDAVVYSELDTYGRVGAAIACISRASLPTALRDDELAALPVGWVTARYPDENGGSQYLYSLCCLISPALGGDAAAAENVFTGTRSLRSQGMQPYEDRIADYVARTTNHVLYRVTPVYDDVGLVPTGVQMEARSLEDGGKSLSFNVFVYNVQPGVSIDYFTGESTQDVGVKLTATAQDLLASHSFAPPSPTPTPTAAPTAAPVSTLPPAPASTVPPAAPESTPRPSVSSILGTVASVAAETKSEGATLVWIAATGKVYHSIENCEHMNAFYSYQRTLDWALTNGYERCEYCW